MSGQPHFIEGESMTDNKMLYPNISKLCAEHGISIRSLENHLGFSNGTIQGWKRTNPRLDSLISVCSYFHVSMDELVGFDPVNGIA